MRRVLIFVFLVILLSLPVRAMEFSAPDPPESAQSYLPREAETFGEGLWNVLSAAIETLNPSLTEASNCCLRVFGAVLLVGLVAQFSTKLSKNAMELAGVAAVTALLLEPSGALIELGAETVRELRDYGKLLLPVLASALAARGGVSTSAALYVGTAVFDSILSAAVSGLILPGLWTFLAVSVAHAAVGEPVLGKLRDLLHWAMEWALKLTLYLFTGYMAVTGVISGTADAAAGKAARIAISGAVPVVGGILSDATDAVLLAASTLGSGAGVWGILTVIAVFCAPVIRIGVQYLMLKITAAVGESLGELRCAKLIGDFAGALGLLTALVSTQAVLLLISAVCFLRGVGV